MRFLILNTDYPEFLTWLYAQNPGVEKTSYDEQLRVRMESLFGVADFYSRNLRSLGHEACDIHANNERLQRAWAREHGLRMPVSEIANPRWQTTELLSAVNAPLRRAVRMARPLLQLVHGSTYPRWFHDVLEAQIEFYRPDVLLNQDMAIDRRFLRAIKPRLRLLVGQHAATRLDESDWSCYDVVISSFPPTLEFFRRRGIAAELSRLAFEPRVLSESPTTDRPFDVSFVGSFHKVHESRTELLELVARHFPELRVWGPGLQSLGTHSPIRASYQGQAWGRQMYQVFGRSKIVLNHHGDVAPSANNLRLFEATGMGALLLTDWKENLSEMFEPDKEVIAYRSTEECIQLLSRYLQNDQRRAGIAGAGQERTLKEHTYLQRMEEIVGIVQRYL
jgi:hypothetical protein